MFFVGVDGAHGFRGGRLEDGETAPRVVDGHQSGPAAEASLGGEEGGAGFAVASGDEEGVPEGAFVGEAFPEGEEAPELLRGGHPIGAFRVGQGMRVEADVDDFHAAREGLIFGKEEADFRELEGEGSPGADDVVRVGLAVVFAQEA